MLIKLFCPRCRRRIYLVRLLEDVVERCPQCGGSLTPQQDTHGTAKNPLDALLKQLPLTDLGSRERPFYLEEEELLMLGRHLLDSISMVGEWSKRSREQLEREAQDLKRLIAYLEETGRDPLLRKIEFLILSSFIKNYYG